MSLPRARAREGSRIAAPHGHQPRHDGFSGAIGTSADPGNDPITPTANSPSATHNPTHHVRTVQHSGPCKAQREGSTHTARTRHRPGPPATGTRTGCCQTPRAAGWIAGELMLRSHATSFLLCLSWFASIVVVFPVGNVAGPGGFGVGVTVRHSLSSESCWCCGGRVCVVENSGRGVRLRAVVRQCRLVSFAGLPRRFFSPDLGLRRFPWCAGAGM